MTLREARRAAGLTQVELAQRAGVSRQLVGAVEAGKHVPRVDAALAIAAVLEVDVAALFGREPVVVDILTGSVPPEHTAVRTGMVGDTAVTAAAGVGGEGWNAADAVVEDGQLSRFVNLRPGLVVAGCEPGLPLLEQLLRERAMAAVAVGASSAAARAALDAGRVHAAVVHGPDAGASRDGRHARFGIASWRVGLAAPPEAAAGWWQRALSGVVPVIQRERGAAVQQAFEESIPQPTGTPVPGPRVDGHVAAVRHTMLTGFPSVTIEPAALAAGAAFRALQLHVAELLVAPEWLDEPPVTEALETLASRRFQRRLEMVGGYDLRSCGARVA